MRRGLLHYFFCSSTLVALAGAVLSLWAEDLPSQTDSKLSDVQALSATIDQLISKCWSDESIIPSTTATDAEFIRRIYLDLSGKIPPVSDVRDFLNDLSVDKRARLIERLLDHPSYIVHFTNVWRRLLLPELERDPQLQFVSLEFDAWLRKQLAENTRYDVMVRRILTTELDGLDSNSNNLVTRETNARPTAFYAAKQIKPERLASTTARVFLGLRVDCAQCHDHPFASWTQEDFWASAAFFSGIQQQAGNNPFDFSGLFEKKTQKESVQIQIPETETIVSARFLDGSKIPEHFSGSPREMLADWLTSTNNPYFARSAVNRMWAHFFGIGLINPIDDMDEDNPPSHPELLERLSREFIEHDFNLKFLAQAITNSKIYQLSSNVTDPSQQDPQLYARMTPKSMTPEQLLDSLIQATGGRREIFRTDQRTVNPNDSPRGELLELFSGDEGNRTERTTSVLQALAMMNGRLVNAATSPDESVTLDAVANFPLLKTSDRIEALYLAALSRKPTQLESTRLVNYVESGSPDGDQAKVLSDVFWALLNSSEFMLNH